LDRIWHRDLQAQQQSGLRSRTTRWAQAREQRMVKASTNAAIVPGNARFYVHDEAGHIIGEYDQDGNPVYEMVYLGDTPIAVITQVRTGSGDTLNVATKTSYLYSDHLDTPRVIARLGPLHPVALGPGRGLWQHSAQCQPQGAGRLRLQPTLSGADLRCRVRIPLRDIDHQKNVGRNL
jgi:hypothetical protein